MACIEDFSEGQGGAPPVAQESLPLARNFRERKRFPSWNEDGVVAEAGGAPRLAEDLSLADSLDHERRVCGADEREHKADSLAPFMQCSTFQRNQQGNAIRAVTRH